jgi:hypothetical protein
MELSYLARPFQELKDTVNLIAQEHEDKKSCSHPFGPEEKELLALTLYNDTLEKNVEWILNDGFGQLVNERFPSGDIRQHQVLGELVGERDFLLKRHPLHVGTLKYGLYLLLQKRDLVVEYSSQLIMTLAHIYVVMGLVFQGGRSWPDMEFILWRQDPVVFFSGGLPKTLTGSFKKFRLAAGATLSNFVSDTRHKSWKYDINKVRTSQCRPTSSLITSAD